MMFLCERFVALVTLEQLLTRVLEHVPCQRILADVGFVTERALERRLPLVLFRGEVVGQMMLLGELFVAFSTLVCLFC